MNRKREPDASVDESDSSRKAEEPPRSKAGRFNAKSEVRQRQNTMTWSSEAGSGERAAVEVQMPKAEPARKQTLQGIKVTRKSMRPPMDSGVEKRDTMPSPPPREERRSSGQPATRPRRRDTARVYVAVEEVGVRAVRIAEKARDGVAPKVIASRDKIRRSPITQHAAFVLAFIDGATDESGLVDITGLPIEVVREILQSLVDLEIIEIKSS